MTRRRMASTVAVAAATLGATAAHASGPPLPNSIAAIGDSISQAYDVCCSCGDLPLTRGRPATARPTASPSHCERVLTANSAVNQAAQYVTILIGANDVCTLTIAGMTPTATFQSQFRSTMPTLESALPAGAHIFVSSIPNIHNLWSVLHTNGTAEFVWAAAQICQSMLNRNNTEAQRQRVLAQEQADNSVLQQVCQQYANACGTTSPPTTPASRPARSATSTTSTPNLSGQAALATTTWGASWWPATP